MMHNRDHQKDKKSNIDKIRVLKLTKKLRKQWDRELKEKYGREWFKKNKKFLDAQWEYLKSL